MKKQIELTLEQASEIYKTADNSMKALLESNFEELKPKIFEGWYINDTSRICSFSSLNNIFNPKFVINTFATEKQAKSALAYAQLTQKMKELGDGFAGIGKFFIDVMKCNEEGVRISTLFNYDENRYSLFSFNEKRKAFKFLDENYDLIKQFYQI